MSSLLCVKNLRGSVEVHDKAVADDLQTIDTDYQRMRATVSGPQTGWGYV